MGRGKRFGSAIFIGVAALVVVGAGAALGWRVWRGPHVVTSVVQKKTIVRSLVVSGRVSAAGRATLGATASGVVQRVLFREGQRVKRGEVLAELDRRELQASVDQARAAVRQSNERLQEISKLSGPVADQSLRQLSAALSRAEADWQRAETMLKSGAISAKEHETAAYNYELARSQLAAAKAQAQATGQGGVARQQAEASRDAALAQLRAAEARLAQASVVAPADGVLLERQIEPGDVVSIGRTLFVFQSDYETNLKIHPDEKALADLKLGQQAIATADAFPDVTFAARVAYIAPSVDPERATVEVRLVVDQPPPFLRPEMTVSVDIELGRSNDAIAVPSVDVRDARSSEPWVLVVDDGRAKRQVVALGLRGRELTEVRRGLSPGQIVVAGTERVRDGDRVKAK